MIAWRAIATLVRGEWRAHRRAPGSLLFTLTGIALATALVVGVDLANSAARGAYEEGFARANAGLSHSIAAIDGSLTDADYVQLHAAWRSGDLPEVVGMAPLLVVAVELRSQTTTSPPRAYELWGVDVLQDAALRIGSLATTAGIASLDRPSAWGQGVTPGPAQLRVAALPFGAAAAGEWHQIELVSVDAEIGANATGPLVADIATAQELTGRLGVLSRIDVRLRCAPTVASSTTRGWLARLFPGLDAQSSPADDGVAARCAVRLQERLPRALRVESLLAQRDEDLTASAAFEFNLGALSLLAAAVAAFLVYQVVTLGVNQRLVEYGRLRALGMFGREIALRVVAGYLGIALLAGVMGSALGVWLARWLVEIVSAVVNDLFYRSAVTGVAVDPVSVAKGLAVAIGVALLATIAPALRIARTPPAQLLAGELRARSAARVPWFGLACAAAATVALVTTRGIAGALLAIGLLLLATVALAGRSIPRLRPSARWPLVPRLALADLARTSRDAGIAVGALIVAVATAFGMSWMIASFRGALEDVLEARLAADLLVRVAPADSALLRRLQAEPGVREVALAARDEVVVSAVASARSVRTALRIVELPASEAQRLAIARESLGGARVAISEPLAHRLAVGPGDLLDFARCRVRVGAVFKEYGSVQGRLVVDRRGAQRCTVLPPASEAELRGSLSTARVRTLLGDARELLVAQPAAIRSVSLRIFDRTFAITAVVRWLALLVAAIALFASLSLWTARRAGEIGVLRAVGLQGGELAALLALQALLMGVVAVLIALPVGAAIAWILCAELHPRAFGWSFPLRLSFEPVASSIVVALLAVFAGAAGPMLALLRAPAVQWLRTARHD